jgi:hypothetical protein
LGVSIAGLALVGSVVAVVIVAVLVVVLASRRD